MTQSFLRPWFALVAACLLALTSSAQAPLRVFLRGGPKTHGPGEHDHPAFVADWQPLLAARGAVVEGALRFPTREELEHTDVLVLYAAEAGSIHGEERAGLEAYLARGGIWWRSTTRSAATIPIGSRPWSAAPGSTAAKWATGTTDLYVRDFDHPITRGVANWRFEDELYTGYLEPDAHVLMAGFQDMFTISPQRCGRTKANYRAFVAIQGH
ncbi:MAG: ThuA domain-containing protein, partial [Planctomycetes bacterium]|nr:ThuA domain-containing protein [Planctomycetota bacterium]